MVFLNFQGVLRNGRRPWFVAYSYNELPPLEQPAITAPTVNSVFPRELYQWIDFNSGSIIINMFQYHYDPIYGFNGANFRATSVHVSTTTKQIKTY